MPGSAPESSRAPFKLLMTADAVGGVWQYAADLVTALSGHGVEVLLAVLGPAPSEEQTRVLRTLPRVTLFHRDYALEWMNEPWRDVDAAGDWLLQLQAEFQPDLIHLNSYSYSALSWQKPVLVMAHSCVFSWWRAVYNRAPGPEWSEYKRRVISGLGACAVAVGPSRFMTRALEQEYGVDCIKVRVIHNFSYMPLYEGRPKQDCFLAAGRLWDPAKNLMLLEALAAGLRWPVFVAGNDRGPEQASDPVRAVRPLGLLSREQMTRQLQAASVFLHPALYEPFGLSVLEAARSGCCLALSDIPSLRELWEDAAVFLDPRDPEQWRFELNALTRDVQRRGDLARRALARVHCYSTETSTAEYLHLYRSLLNKTSGKGVAA